MPDPVQKRRIGLTDYAWQLLTEIRAEHDLPSDSAAIEWLVLCQRHDATAADAIFRRRRRRGRRGAIHVVPDDFELPPEGD